MQRPDLRSLPPRERAQALRELLRERLPRIPRAVVRFPSKRARHGKGIHSFAFAAGLLAAATLAPTHAARAGTLDLDVTTTAIHTRAWARRSLNQVNPGAGIEYHFTRTWGGAMGGAYRNGYTRRENSVAPLMAAGVLRVRAPDGLGVNLLWVPNPPHGGCGFVGFQIAVPLC